MGGDNTCKYTCKMIGHTGGTCDEEYNCVCSGDSQNTSEMEENLDGVPKNLSFYLKSCNNG